MLRDARKSAVRRPRRSIGSTTERQFWAEIDAATLTFTVGGEQMFATAAMASNTHRSLWTG